MKKLQLLILKKMFGLVKGKYRNKILNLIKKKDGNEFFSKVLREIYKKYYNIEIGIGSYGCFNRVQFPDGTKIGNYCSIAAGVKYLNGNHPKHFVSTHPLFYNKDLKYVKEDKITRSNLTVGHDVWIGYNVIILPSVTQIGTGAIIGAGSIVSKDVDEFGIYVGVPAKKIGQRFDDEKCQKILESKWYLKEPEQLKDQIPLFEDTDLFIEKYLKN